MKISNSFKIEFAQLYIHKIFLMLSSKQHPAKYFLLLLFFSIIFIACSHSDVDHQKFINAYIDLRITEDTLQLGTKSIESVKKEILKKHGLTEQQYEETFNHFNENPELWNKFYDEIIARVDTLRKGK